MKLGVRLSIYDDHDNEVAARSAWVPNADLSAWRPAYDDLCAALWDVMGDLVAHPPAATPAASTPTGVSQ